MIMSKILKIYILVIPLLFFVLKDYSFAQTHSEVVEATLRLSICGDGVVEGKEDCEKDVPITKTCLNYGYQKGTLLCDNSCSFDFTNCQYIPKPPEETTQTEEDEPITQELKNTKIVVEEIKVRYMPLLLRMFDLNRDGRIDFAELTNILINWVDNWRTFRQVEEEQKEEVKGTCDVNFDGMCNVIDFSIILYYVDND